MSADFDPLKTARINLLHHGIEAIAWEQNELAFRLRDCFYQAIADINVGWITAQTENALICAEQLVQLRGRAA